MTQHTVGDYAAVSNTAAREAGAISSGLRVVEWTDAHGIDHSDLMPAPAAEAFEIRRQAQAAGRISTWAEREPELGGAA